MDFEAVKQGLSQAVPFVRTLGLEYLDLSAENAVLRLPDDPAFHNHVGGPHAGAIFTLAESASGAVVIASFGDLLDRVTPLAAGAEIAYTRLAKGPVVAEAQLGRSAADVRQELADTGRTVQFPVEVAVRTDDGTQTAQMTVRWALRPHRQG